MPDTLTTTETEIKQEALTVIERSKIIKIVDQASYDSATSLLLNEIKPFRTRWKAYWDTLREPAYAAYQAVLGKFNEADKPLELAEKSIKSEIARWETEQAVLLAQAQRKAQEEAEARAEEERLQAATLAEESGATEEEVKAIVEAVAPVVAAPVTPTFQRAAGMSKPRDNWCAEVVDMKKLCKAIGAGKVPTSYVLPNDTALNARAKADRETLNIDGVKAVNKPIISGRIR